MISITIQDPGRPDHVASSIEFTSDVLTDPDGMAVGTVDALAFAMIGRAHESEAMRDATGQESTFKIVADDPGAPPPSGSEEPRPLYIQAIMDGVSVNAVLKSITVEGAAKIVVTEIPIEHGEIDSVPYSFGEAISVENESIALFLTEGAPARAGATMKIGSEIVTSSLLVEIFEGE